MQNRGLFTVSSSTVHYTTYTTVHYVYTAGTLLSGVVGMCFGLPRMQVKEGKRCRLISSPFSNGPPFSNGGYPHSRTGVHPKKFEKRDGPPFSNGGYPHSRTGVHPKNIKNEVDPHSRTGGTPILERGSTRKTLKTWWTPILERGVPPFENGGPPKKIRG